jgi:hypothetical protein
MKSWVRTITVHGIRYIQAVETVYEQDKRHQRVHVLKSFGKESIEAIFSAELYCAARDVLRKFRDLISESDATLFEVQMENAALSVFGHIIGREEVERIIHESHD